MCACSLEWQKRIKTTYLVIIEGVPLDHLKYFALMMTNGGETGGSCGRDSGCAQFGDRYSLLIVSAYINLMYIL